MIRVAALVACAAAAWGGTREAPAGKPASPSHLHAAASFDQRPLHMTDSLRLELLLPERVRRGERVPITLRVSNTSGRPMVLYLTGRPIAFDVVITRGGREPVWRRLHGQNIPAILQVRTLQPGERLELAERWDQRDQSGARVAPGRYAAEGVLLTDGEPLRTDVVPFEITGR